jgi:hypothetical protein
MILYQKTLNYGVILSKYSLGSKATYHVQTNISVKTRINHGKKVI